MSNTLGATLTTKEDEAKKLATAPNGLGAKKFEGDGFPFRAKLIGMEDLSIDRDEKVCLDSMFKLKAVVRARGEHKQKIQLNLTMSAVKVIDEATKAQIAIHEIERISFVVIDPRDTRAFGYIYNTSDDRHQFWAIKTERAAAVTVLALKELFELAFEQYTNAEKAKGLNESTVTATPTAPVTSPVQAPPQNVPVYSPPPPTQTVPVSTPQPDIFSAPVLPPPSSTTTTPTPVNVTSNLLDGDIWGDTSTPQVTQTTQSISDDIFNLNEPPSMVTQQQESKPVDALEDIFSVMSTVTQPPVSTGSSNALFDVFSNPTPVRAPPPVNPYNNFYSQPTQPNILNAAPTFNQPPPMAFTTMSSPQQSQTNLLSPSPISPVAPPSVTNPLAGLDIFGSLAPSSTTAAAAAKTTRDSFFPATSTTKTIQQMQMEKQS